MVSNPATVEVQRPPEEDEGGRWWQSPIARMVWKRALLGVFTLVLIAVIVYFATTVLPGDAATAILGTTATPARVAKLKAELGLDEPLLTRFVDWFGHAIRGDFGNSLSAAAPVGSQGGSSKAAVTTLVNEKLLSSAVLIGVTAIVSTLLGILAGMYAAFRRDGVFDTGGSTAALVASALPEFVVAIFVVMLFAVNVFDWFPALSLLPPGESILDHLNMLVLPVLALVIVTTPYVFRMTRGAMIEVLDTDYVEFARMKGVSPRRIAFRHALPNALAPVIQVVGLNLLYLAGGIVLVEAIFSYPGVGLALVEAINGRDVPTIQYIVLLLAVFYVILNIVTDVGVLLVTPRRRYPR
jgi:peptide/nickel transport system permease protein